MHVPLFLLGVLPVLWGHIAVQGGSSQCVPREFIKERLEQAYGEVLILSGTSREGDYLFELYVGKDGGWTIVQTDASSGCSTPVLAGTDMQATTGASGGDL